MESLVFIQPGALHGFAISVSRGLIRRASRSRGMM
jgi:hypothetical protein